MSVHEPSHVLEGETARSIEDDLLLLAVLDSDQRIRRLTPAWSRFRATEAIAGEDFAALLVPDDVERARSALMRLDTAREISFDVRLRDRPPGQASYVWIRFHAKRDGDEFRLVGMDVSDLKGAQRSPTEDARQRLLTTMAGSAPCVLWAVDKTGHFTLAEGKGLETLGAQPGEWVGRDALVIWKGTRAHENIARAMAGEAFHDSLTVPGPIHYEAWYVPVLDPQGEPDGMVGLALDVTRQKLIEEDLREKLEVIERQGNTIRALGTPILKVWDRILCLPIIGTVDSQRTSEMLEALLNTVVEEGAQFAIVDLTGVSVVDTNAADHLIRLFKAARLLGAEGVLCGMQPAVAQTVVALGTTLGKIATAPTLAEALKWCLGQMRRVPQKASTNGSAAPRELK